MNPEARTTAAHHFLAGLAEAGLEYLFCNLGTDHVSLIEAMAQFAREGRRHPEVVLCPHENVAIHMAGGYAAVTGRGQGVLVHVDAGTANAAMGMHNLFRSRWPVLLMAGRSPFTLRGELTGSRDNYVHFVQDPFDIASLVRPYVKWEYTLASGVVAKEVLRRAHTVMHSDPPGPVFLTLPRETLAEACDAEVASFPAERFGPVRAGGIPAGAAREIARALVQARKPIVVTSYLGRRPEAVAALEALAAECGIRVHEFMPTALSVSRDAPCFGGFDPAQGLAGADLCLLLDVDVPWLPKFTGPDAGTRFLHIDIDPLKQDFPMWGFATDLRLQADCAAALADILQAVRTLADDDFRARVAQRTAGWSRERDERLRAVAVAGAAPGARGAIAPAFVCATLNRALSQDDLVVNEAIRNSPAVLAQIHRTRAGTLLGCSGGGLGYSGGMALGAKLARPAQRVVQVCGDGGFHFSTPTSVYAVAQRAKLPILTVVLDNGGWQAVKEAVLRVYPEGEAARANQFHARLDGEVRRFDRVAEAFGAHGEYVDAPEDLEQALQRSLQAVDGGRAAVLHVKVGGT
ncbi:thiamine pyrophosphate-requiring protein [Ramlibacter monticola]|uniref:Thiamine pyrophosphate-requiring protein n=1 Tax=Ramlibacter monticola TaxID=1926872 RepID=A0A937CRS6_9BURK|nr:thiamine pyrophosphate-requiring protein [Ramlibacter monticola]MBL0390421.1 thiamine pyrophosphate-requiring protein [Ramlibacter monticola]